MSSTVCGFRPGMPNGHSSSSFAFGVSSYRPSSFFFPFGFFIFVFFLFFLFRGLFWGWGGWGWRGYPMYGRYGYGHHDGAAEILRRRYAGGEITKDQFDQMMRDITQSRNPPT